jgi:opacity protein-like surface antigen
MKNAHVLMSLVALVGAGTALAGEPSYYNQEPAASPLYGGTPGAGGWFAGIRGSALWLEDIGYITDTGLGSVGLDANFEVGWGVTVPFGYQFSNGFGLGGSLGYYSAGIDEISVLYRGRQVGEVGLDADASTLPILFNASYQFRFSDTLSLTLGAGAGLAWSQLDIDDIGGRDYDLSVDGWDFSFQGFGSFNYSVSQSADLTVGYRYIQTETDEDSLQGHNLEAGVVIKF